VLQRAGPTPFFLIRTTGDPAAIAGTVRRKMKELEPARAVFGLTPLEEHLNDAYRENGCAPRSLQTSQSARCCWHWSVCTVRSAISLTVRRREVGVRLALGALKPQIIGRFLAQGLRVATSPARSASASRLLLGRLLSGMLYGVSPDRSDDAGVRHGDRLGGAGIASIVPAVRSALVEPMQVLRDE
jgi:hypothetical protein